MPKGTRVSNCVERLKGRPGINPYAICQASTHQSYATGKALKKRRKKRRGTWGIRFDSGTNRWKFQSWMYGTNAPVVLTNNTRLVIDAESEGTNTWAEYKYYAPAK